MCFTNKPNDNDDANSTDNQTKYEETAMLWQKGRVSWIVFTIDNDDGIGNNTQQQSTKQNFTNFANTDLNGERKFNTIVRICSRGRRGGRELKV